MRFLCRKCMPKNNLTIIIPHWNTPEALEEQLSILGMGEFEVVVVDNASEKSLAKLEKKFPRVLFIHNSLNRGFAFACNQGAMVTSNTTNSKWLFFLNPDVLMPVSDIEWLVSVAESQNLVAASPFSESENYRKPVPSFFSLLVEFSPFSRLVQLKNWQPQTLPGAHFLIQRIVLTKLGGWDERFR